MRHKGKMNLEIIKSNILEALEELQNIKDEIESKDLEEIDFEIMLRHVYHHLNVAWNIRNKSTNNYRNMNDNEFEEWGKYPKDIDFDK